MRTGNLKIERWMRKFKLKLLASIPRIIISLSSLFYENLAFILYIVDVIVKGKIILWAIKLLAIDESLSRKGIALWGFKSQPFNLWRQIWSYYLYIFIYRCVWKEYSKVLITGCTCVLFIFWSRGDF